MTAFLRSREGGVARYDNFYIFGPILLTLSIFGTKVLFYDQLHLIHAQMLR